MLIDKLLFWLVPRMVHEWAADNRAKVRAYALALATPIAVFAAEQWISDDWRAVIISAFGSAGAVVVGRKTHKVVTPFDEDA